MGAAVSGGGQDLKVSWVVVRGVPVNMMHVEERAGTGQKALPLRDAAIPRAQGVEAAARGGPARALEAE